MLGLEQGNGKKAELLHRLNTHHAAQVRTGTSPLQPIPCLQTAASEAGACISGTVTVFPSQTNIVPCSADAHEIVAKI